MKSSKDYQIQSVQSLTNICHNERLNEKITQISSYFEEIKKAHLSSKASLSHTIQKANSQLERFANISDKYTKQTISMAERTLNKHLQNSATDLEDTQSSLKKFSQEQTQQFDKICSQQDSSQRELLKLIRSTSKKRMQQLNNLLKQLKTNSSKISHKKLSSLLNEKCQYLDSKIQIIKELRLNKQKQNQKHLRKLFTVLQEIQQIRNQRELKEENILLLIQKINKRQQMIN